ncbi:helix-turn-helix domain-containing protein [Streptomyces sp. NPDC048484]|uniref:helix-turn-helix domain-containing protein n=1 Tax=Streptomyces sp. NPDC048484 TaxID=3155146 RepID=UPI003415B78F
MSTRDDDVEEFAALLRQLKARTDRSYGALARRVNMNTSTLHRYCAGDAVPLDFAPVERFATLCGATPAERLELHRRWILAVAARQRPRTPGPPESPAPDTAEPQPQPRTNGEPGPGPLPEPAGEVAASASAARATGASGTQTHDLPAPSPAHDLVSEADSGSEAGSETGSETGSGSETETGSGSGSETETRSDSGAGPVVGSDPRPRRAWYRRRRVTVTVSAVSALLATLGGLSALPDGRSSHHASPTAGPSPTTTKATSGARHRPSTSPSPGTSPSPSAGSTGKASTSPGNSGAPSKNTKNSKNTKQGGSGSGAVPLTWTANSQAWKLGCGHDYVIRKEPQQVPPPPAPQDAGTWAATQGAVHGRETNVEISVQGRTSTAVVLTALRVRVVGRTAPVPGTVYAMDQGCGGSITPRSFAVDLDKDRPIARSVPGNDTGTPIPAVRMPYRVSAEDPEVLLVNARTETCGCSWYLELDWSSEGRTGTARIDDHGRPFRTSGIKGLPRYWYASDGADGSERRWVPAD